MKWLKDDGTLDLNALDSLAADVKAVTDSSAVIDQVVKAAKLDTPKVMAFRCAHSGLYFPSDYAKAWGHTTGIGLGPDVVSECLDSHYHIAPPELKYVRRPQDIMHPLGVTFAQVDLVVVPEDEYSASQLTLERDDPSMEIRAALLRSKQIASSKGMVAAYSAEFNRIAKGKQVMA